MNTKISNDFNSGAFDDHKLSCYPLWRFPCGRTFIISGAHASFPEADLLRSRDRLYITPAAYKIIYDVGGDYDIEAKIFDHHQSPGPLRDNGQPFSLFGLVWKHYGRAYLESLNVPSQNIDLIHAQLDDDFVLPIT